MCNYQGYEFGAGSYPDSACIGGRLFDADACDENGNLYDPMEDIPCPMCRRDDAVNWRAERNAFFNDGDDDDATHERKARDTAISLVDDIRRNRGIAAEGQAA